MRSVVNAKMLDELDRLIKRYNLHPRGGLLQPVSLERLLEAYRLEYWVMPEKVQGMRVPMKWRGSRETVEIAISDKLSDECEAANRRATILHEIGHDICKHKNGTFMLYDLESESDGEVSRFDKWLDAHQEKEASQVGAYLGVPAEAVRSAGAGMEMWYIGGMIDLPEDMVKLRWKMMEKLRR